MTGNDELARNTKDVEEELKNNTEIIGKLFNIK